MENTAVAKQLKSKGRVVIKEGNGRLMEIIQPASWTESDSSQGIFLIFDLFQIRSLTEQFSEVSLDVVDFATKATIYHSPVNRVLQSGPIVDGKVKFSLIRNEFWNKLLFAFSQPVVFQEVTEQDVDFESKERFPLYGPDVKELYLSPEGDVKILKG
ncbi:hypothetical protein SAMN06295967_10623 [Belliella buryatensis]|uniref:Uncharacterized protein n=1 Tax=Belliella buryatensis TaxID=1500549 RepID=A0A239CYU1_9BACT|nr:hypothetical protein [Belliella buryatensis]SNS25207.1 hypothetical protein SAMN06295967_10623 [Belliella buryatensis]